MTITRRVQQQFFAAPSGDPNSSSASVAINSTELIRLAPTVITQHRSPGLIPKKPPPVARKNLWTIEEHERFLLGLELFHRGPWKKVAAIVGTKTTRQTMTHAQKYRQKIERHTQRSAMVESRSIGAMVATNTAPFAFGHRVVIINPLSPAAVDGIQPMVVAATEEEGRKPPRPSLSVVRTVDPRMDFVDEIVLHDEDLRALFGSGETNGWRV